MIANAPEKMYLIQDNGLVCYCRNTDEDVEYTRTDAFIEKACEWIRDNHLKYPSEDCADTAKFIKDFKRYLKGE